jgi:beta-phosphoglucomutase-like phosphatase (HAD superfamily)
MNNPLPKKIEVPGFIRGLIFDCDGTLVNSMPLHMKAWEYAVTQEGGIWDYEFFFSKKGMQEKDIVESYNTKNYLQLNSAKTVEAKHSYFRLHRNESTPIRPVVDLVFQYNTVLPMAVASGGIREIVHFQLASLGIEHYFKVILTADDDIKPKPHPDIFLEAASRLGVQPHLCQVFEDGDLGLQAAEKAGMMATDVRLFL